MEELTDAIVKESVAAHHPETVTAGVQEVTRVPGQTVGPRILNPFKSIVTLSAKIEMAVVLASGTVRFPNNL